MSNFFSEIKVKDVRKRKPCGWCDKFCESGNSSIRITCASRRGFWYFESFLMHPECMTELKKLDTLKQDKWVHGELTKGDW